MSGEVQGPKSGVGKAGVRDWGFGTWGGKKELEVRGPKSEVEQLAQS